MSAGFSTGPWSFGKKYDGYQEIDAKNSRFEWKGLARVVVESEGHTRLEPDAEGEANARLIAAAPELYEALERAREVLIDEDQSVAYIDAALAKARGE